MNPYHFSYRTAKCEKCGLGWDRCLCQAGPLFSQEKEQNVSEQREHNTVAFCKVAGPTTGKTGARFEWSFTVRADDAAALIASLRDYEARLIQAGCIPFDAYIEQRKSDRQQAQPVANGNGAAPTGEPPVCKFHGQPMKRSTKFNGWYCTKKLTTGEYCPEQIKD